MMRFLQKIVLKSSLALISLCLFSPNFAIAKEALGSEEETQDVTRTSVASAVKKTPEGLMGAEKSKTAKPIDIAFHKGPFKRSTQKPPRPETETVLAENKGKQAAEGHLLFEVKGKNMAMFAVKKATQNAAKKIFNMATKKAGKDAAKRAAKRAAIDFPKNATKQVIREKGEDTN